MLYAMMPNNIHKASDYLKVAQDYDAVCHVFDEVHHISMTGVLIAPDIVITCAHGIQAGGRYRLFFQTPTQKITATSSAVLIDERYKASSKFDIAFLRLNTPIDSIVPAKLAPQLSLSLPLTVVTAEGKLKRGFYLYEIDKFGDADSLKEERSCLFSSLFFHPDGHLPEDATDEMRIRTKEALSHWHQHGKGPYALTMRGTSGGPVFVKQNGQDYLFGMVTSFATLDRGLDPEPSLKQASSWYQTLFTSFYLQTKDHDPLKACYKQDEEIQNLIQKTQQLPVQTNIFKVFYEKYIRPFCARSCISSKT